jgi:hypothetical protein
MHLWGQGATVAAAALRAPPRQQLSGPLEVSPDGRLVYAMTHAGQVRQGRGSQMGSGETQVQQVGSTCRVACAGKLHY